MDNENSNKLLSCCQHLSLVNPQYFVSKEAFPKILFNNNN